MGIFRDLECIIDMSQARYLGCWSELLPVFLFHACILGIIAYKDSSSSSYFNSKPTLTASQTKKVRDATSLILRIIPTEDTDQTRDWSSWSDLPSELLQEIASRKLTNIRDHVRFRAVCSNWRAIPCITTYFLSSHLPWLLFEPPNPTTELTDDNDDSRRHRLVSLFDRRVYTIRLPVYGAGGMRIMGSSFGYLLLLDRGRCKLTLLNPFTGSQIELPPLPARPFQRRLPYEKITQAKLVKSDSSSYGFSAIVAINLDPQPLGVFCCRPGDSKWSKIDYAYNVRCRDFAYFDTKFIAMEINGKTPGIIGPTDKIDGTLVKCFLVESSHGELLKVVRTIDGANYNMFEVFQMDTSNKQEARWVKVTDIGDDVIFLDAWGAISFPASDFGGCGCKGNYIYYWNKKALGWFDMGESKVDCMPPCNWDNFPNGLRCSLAWVKPSP